MFDLIQEYKTILAKWDSGLENGKFLEKHKNHFNGVILGTTFCPEHINNKEKSLEFLKIMVEEMGIKDIRIGIRWNKTQPLNNKDVSLEYYKPLLDYLFKKNINLCLSIGPAKTPRWPETHIPAWVFEKISCPIKGCELNMENGLSIMAVEYFEKLTKKIAKIIPKKNLDKIMFQIENECFNKFGEYEWIFSFDYLNKCTDIIKSKFPKNKILLSTSGSRKAKEIFDFTQSTQYPSLDFILSLNYYYLYDTNYGSQFSFLVDDFVRKGKLSMNQVKNTGTKKGIQIEIGEAQMEPWKKHTEPGNSVKSLRFVLLRCLQARPKTQENYIIRLWGIERFLENYTSDTKTIEHENMVELIKSINRV